MLNFAKSLPHIYEDDHVTSVFECIYRIYYTYWFLYIEIPLTCYNADNLNIEKYPLNVYLNLLCKYFMKTFICVHKGIGLQLFFVLSFLVSILSLNCLCKNMLVTFFSFLLNKIIWGALVLLLIALHSCRCALLLFGRIFITTSNVLLIIFQLKLCITSWFTFYKSYVFGTYYLDFPIY